MSDLILPRKFTVRAHGSRLVFAKGFSESAEHVLMKIFLWALYLPPYPALTVEVRIGDRYKPDVVALDDAGKPRFWGESGKVAVAKIRSLARRYPSTHFAIAKWDTRLAPLVEIVQEALEGLPRRAPFDLLTFAPDSVQRFIDREWNVQLTHDEVEWLCLSCRM
jgi:hypothetical protein